jgi:hypothetical protein
MDEYTYMSKLPVERLCELHFTGLHKFNGHLQDHLEVLEDDWPVLEWVLEQIHISDWANPWMLALEYGGVGKKFAWRSDPDVIATDIPRLHSLIKVT